MHLQKLVFLLTLTAVGPAAIALPIFGLSNGVQGGGGRGGGGGGGGGGNTRGQPSPQAIDKAASSWQKDTSVVSNFLSTAESLSRRQIQKQASVALAAENDELIHKAVLDKVFLAGPRSNRDATVQQADNVLDKQGTFQFVVDGLETLTNKGARMSTQQVSSLIQAINDDRCPQVLPNIDRYMAAAAGAGSSGRQLKAVRPTQCST